MSVMTFQVIGTRWFVDQLVQIKATSTHTWPFLKKNPFLTGGFSTQSTSNTVAWNGFRTVPIRKSPPGQSPSGQYSRQCPTMTWWRHQMETFYALLVICVGNSPVPDEFPTQRPVTRTLMLSLICVWINGWVNNGEAGDLRRYRAH